MKTPKFLSADSSAVFALLLGLVFQSATVAEKVAKIIVDAGEHVRVDTPISMPLDRIRKGLSTTTLRLQEVTGSERVFVPTQIDQAGSGQLSWILFGTTPAGTKRVFELLSEASTFSQALENGRLANEGFKRCKRYVKGWLEHADPKTGLIPRKISTDKDKLYWDAANSAADNYPFMVLTAAMIDRPVFEGRMLDMLRTETRLTSRIGTLPDTYLFSKHGFQDAEPDMGRIMFGASEYIKDGLLPVTEWLGPSPWSQRMIAMLDDMWKRAPIETKYGNIVSDSQEINGEMLQALSRIYWMTGEKKYLNRAIRLGDYYLLDSHHPTRDENKLRLRDHGCEIVSGLCELYATVHFARQDKKQSYQKPIHEMLDRILEVGRNEHGLFYDSINPRDGSHSEALCDTWGYTLNGYYTVYLIDGTEAYRQAVLKALGHINQNYRNYLWEGHGADGYADSIESAINLYNREPVPSTADWIDSEIKVMWNKQQPNGVIEGWHGDGNFARTTLMYCLWKTKGLTIRPWRDDVIFGAAQDADSLDISIIAERPWKGRVIFDRPRHQTNMNMPLDWPRINQFPEWFTVQGQKRYAVENLTTNSKEIYTGKHLQEGITISLQPGIQHRLSVKASRTKSPSSGVEVIENDSFLQIQIGKDKILRYNHAVVPPPQGADAVYARSGFIHPLWSPTGTVLTAIHPQHHIHHMGIWMAWTKTKFLGRKIDFWNLKKGEGTVRFAHLDFIEIGPVFGAFGVQHKHVDLKAPGGEEVVLDETWDVRVYNVGGRDTGYRLWDLVSTQSCATQSPLRILKHHYGGLGFRATDKWTRADYLTSEGKTRKDGQGTRARWCDTFGLTEKGWNGVTIMSHPNNFRHPEPMRIWSEGDIFFGFAPEQLGDWIMEPAKQYVFRYRFYVHEGKISAADAERIWHDFAQPPEVEVQKIADGTGK